MITKKEQKTIKSLGIKKNRKDLSRFVVEGEKTVHAFLDAGHKPLAIYGVHPHTSPAFTAIEPQDMRRISHLKNPSNVLAVFPILLPQARPNKGRIVVLDNVSDPGNLGTIIRLCHWFGIADIVCSPNSVDCYNPKVVQASMGSLAAVDCHYLDLPSFIDATPLPVYGTFLSGVSINQIDVPKDAILIFGNESQGISSQVENTIQHKITIPRGAVDGPESLNVATAAAIVLGSFIR